MSHEKNKPSKPKVNTKTTHIQLAHLHESSLKPHHIYLKETQWSNEDDGVIPQENRTLLSDKIDEYIFKLGYSSVHTVGILLQLLIDGKIRITFKNHTERLEIIDSECMMSRKQALDMFEQYLVEKEQETNNAQPSSHSNQTPHKKKSSTQRLIVQIPNNNPKQTYSTVLSDPYRHVES